MAFELSALTINIWNRQGPWPQRRVLLRKGIEALGPDVVAMQEVIHGKGDSQIEALTPGDGWHSAFGPARERDDGSFYGNAVLSRFPVRQALTFELPCLGVDEPRSVLAAALDTPAGVLPVLTTHFSWRYDHGFVREQQALELARIVDAVMAELDDPLPAVVMGDLNAQPEASEIRFLRGLQALEGTSTFLSDCFANCGEGDGYTFDERRNPFAALWHEQPRRIDYVLIKGPSPSGAGKPLSARVVLDEVRDGVAASDHFGVLASMRMTPP
jgi:endonuclease/exonuclease/phosphatase family metal-dependent hydrolase